MPHLISEKIKIGVSACNFGAKTRYNRRGWDRVADLGREKDSFIWTPVCPEAMSGLGVPRPPMKLVDGNGDDFWQNKARMKNKNGENVSKQVREGALAAMDNLKRAGIEAFVFMEGSPSCGVYRTTLKNQRLGKPPGVFGALLLAEEFFLIPAADLESPIKWWDWRRRLHAFIWLKRKELRKPSELMSVWHDLKFVCQEMNRLMSDEIGRKVAGLNKKADEKEIEKIKKEIMELLRLPSDHKKIKHSAEKQMSYYCKHFNICYAEKLPKAEMGKRKFFDKLIELEKRSIKENIDYGFVPVVFRESR